MAEQIKSFLEQDWKQLAKQYGDFTEHKQSELRKAIQQCGKDTEYPAAQKPYDTEHENFRYFAMCLRNSVYLNPVLNKSHGVTSAVLGWQY